MKTKIILDLDGIVFAPINDAVSVRARQVYGPRAMLTNICKKLNIRRAHVTNKLADITYDCATSATFMPGAQQALAALVNTPGFSVEVCSAIAYPGQAQKLEQFYRALSPEMNKIEKYHLISPLESKAPVYSEIFARCDEDFGRIFALDTVVQNLRRPYFLRMNPVLISTDQKLLNAARQEYCARQFHTLAQFQTCITRKK
ncbi:MAG: hypothetical protein K2L94_04880 [Alphaproteobacteria bacterium]|nr:hypothetical protein [Alphaproteobacteria bacterium]